MALMKINSLILCCFLSFTKLFAIQAADQSQTHANVTALQSYHTNLLNGYVCGQPTNDICLGIKCLNSTRSNIIVCLLCVGQTNSNELWIAPPKFQRVQYHLYDSTLKAVPYLRTYHPADKTYKTSREVPKNPHNVYEGLMWPPFSLPYEHSTLTGMFRIEHGGDYTLVAKGRIMKINDDSCLSTIELPPVSLPIHLNDE